MSFPKRIKRSGICLMVGVALAAAHPVRAAGPGAPLLLVEDGAPAATIVLAENARRTARLAAAELQYHIQLITGATLPIVADRETVEGVRVLVGESAATRALELRNEDFEHQEYLIRFLPDTVVLMGRDQDDFGTFDYAVSDTFPGQFDEQATCYAVYDFLERHCGLRWYLPTEQGMVYDARATLKVSGPDVRRTPVMKYRAMSTFISWPAGLTDEGGPMLDVREQRLLLHRWRMGGEPFWSGHAFEGYYRHYLQDHPEWFAKGYDADMPAEYRTNPPVWRRYDRKTYPVLYYPNMCYTSDGFIEQVVRSARHFFDTGESLPGVGHPGHERMAGFVARSDFFSLFPLDDYRYCKCDACRALIHPADQDPPCTAWRKHPHPFSQWNDRDSDYIFHFVNRVAREVAKTHPDKFLTAASYHQYRYPPTREPLEPNVALQIVNFVMARAAPAMDRAENETLQVWHEESKTSGRPLYLWLHAHRPGRAGELFPGFFARRTVGLMADYHRYGIRGLFLEPAGMPRGTRSFARRLPVVHLLEMYLIYKLADDPTLDGHALIDEFFARYYGAAAAPMQTLYEAIEQVYNDPENYAFNPLYTGYQSEAIAWGRLGTPERMAAFEHHMEAARAAARTEMEQRRVEQFEISVWHRMKTAADAYHAAQAELKRMQRRTLRVPYRPPQAGLEEADWSQIAVLDQWAEIVSGNPTGRKIEGRMLHDGRFLYLRLEEITETAKLVRRPERSIFEEDSWELFFAAEPVPGGGFRQLAINAQGAHVALAYGESRRDWDSGVRILSDTSADDRWVLRIALPLETLLPDGTRPGQTIYFNVLRGNAGQTENPPAGWMPTHDKSFLINMPAVTGAVTLSAELMQDG